MHIKHLITASVLGFVILACDIGNGPKQSTPPAAPVLISPVDYDTTAPMLVWNASNGAVTYRVQLSIDSSFATTIIDDSTVVATSRAAGTLENGTTYYWRVNAKNGNGSSAWSARMFVADTMVRLVLRIPRGGEIYHIGDSIPISFEYWNSNATSHFVTLWFSFDNGLTYDMPVFVESFHYSGARKDTTWVIPTDSTLFGSYISNHAKIRVEDYAKKSTIFDASKQPFTILGQ